MNNLIPFNFNNNDIRVVQDGAGEPWFVATDIAKVLGYRDAANMVRNLDEDEKGTHIVSTIKGNQELSTINESGLYSAILSSRKEQAKPFKKWVTRDVLPSIRKNGMYAKDELLDNPDLLLDVIGRLKLERDLRLQAEQKIAQDAPKVECYNDIMGSDSLISVGGLAKVLNIKGLGRNNLFAKMRDMGVLMHDNKPYQQYVDRGWFKLIQTKYQKPSGDVCINLKTMVYQRGVDGVRKMLLAQMEAVA